MKETIKYCPSFSSYKRWRTKEVKIGTVLMGGDNPIRIQSMANTDTLDTKTSVEQCIRIIEAGGELVRYTAQGLREAENLKVIRQSLDQLGYSTPLVADIHFNPKVAFKAAEIIEKVRINPGNFADKNIGKVDWSDGEFREAENKVREQFIPLLNICKENNTALRIGVNHGSLSERMMSRYGDTPKGMVESAMEFLRICVSEYFNNVVLSMKSSNTRVMIQSNRLLVSRMIEEGMNFPIHLGVTEAGEGEDGRIKSAVGIGAMLNDGIGDTLRVSLTEAPENEIPVARKLVKYISEREDHKSIPEIDALPYDPFEYQKRITKELRNIGGSNPVAVISYCEKQPESFDSSARPEYLYLGDKDYHSKYDLFDCILKHSSWLKEKRVNCFPIYESLDEFLVAEEISDEINFVTICIEDVFKDLSNLANKPVIFILQTENENAYAEQRRAIIELINRGIQIPVIIKRSYRENSLENLQLKSATDIGPLFIDGLGDGILINNEGDIQAEEVLSTSFGILQASRVRMTKTEFISCPGCGRTLFDLQKATAIIKERTSHLKNLKIGIMGCIVNGPGEMADADYGYVGAGAGKIHLYKNKEVVKKNIPEKEAVQELIELIKENGDWVEP